MGFYSLFFKLVLVIGMVLPLVYGFTLLLCSMVLLGGWEVPLSRLSNTLRKAKAMRTRCPKLRMLGFQLYLDPMDDNEGIPK